MIDVQGFFEAEGGTGRCFFCGRRQNVPQRRIAVVMDDGMERGLACQECLELPEAELREQMRENAAHMAEMAEDLRTASRGPIRRVPPPIPDDEGDSFRSVERDRYRH